MFLCSEFYTNGWNFNVLLYLIVGSDVTVDICFLFMSLSEICGRNGGQ